MLRNRGVISPKLDDSRCMIGSRIVANIVHSRFIGTGNAPAAGVTGVGVGENSENYFIQWPYG